MDITSTLYAVRQSDMSLVTITRAPENVALATGDSIDLADRLAELNMDPADGIMIVDDHGDEVSDEVSQDVWIA